MDYPGLLCHTLEINYVLLTYNLRLNNVEMLESVCLALEFGVHGIIIAVGRMRQRLPSFPVLLYGVSPYISL